jgi:hypothetical protein
MTQLMPFAGPVKVKLELDPNGALNTCEPPHELVKVSVPVAGALV